MTSTFTFETSSLEQHKLNLFNPLPKKTWTCSTAKMDCHGLPARWRRLRGPCLGPWLFCSQRERSIRWLQMTAWKTPTPTSFGHLVSRTSQNSLPGSSATMGWTRGEISFARPWSIDSTDQALKKIAKIYSLPAPECAAVWTALHISFAGHDTGRLETTTPLKRLKKESICETSCEPLHKK